MALVLATGSVGAAKQPKRTAGFKCAPDTSPTVYIIASTIRPNVSEIPTCVIAPPLTSLMTIAPVPANTRANVPTDSALSLFHRKESTDSSSCIFLLSTQQRQSNMNFSGIATAAVAADL